ncbi:MAG: hypothetical protein WBC19_14360 [Pyrinomonadaceae bacterium]|nr:hypothetical protein [Chloracidobacterium sp.]
METFYPKEDDIGIVAECTKCGQVHTKCFAHKRRRDKSLPLQPCMKSPMRSSRTKKCANHGGKSLSGELHPNYTNGESTKKKYQHMPHRLAVRFEQLTCSELENLEENIRIQCALETRLYERLSTGESTEAWRRLKLAVREFDRARKLRGDRAESLSKRAFDKIRAIVNEKLDEGYLINEILALQEAERKTTETLIKGLRIRKDIWAIALREEFIADVVHILRKNLPDPKQIQGIKRDLEVRAGVVHIESDSVN